MRNFFEIINEYPLTAILLGVFIVLVLDILSDIFKHN